MEERYSILKISTDILKIISYILAALAVIGALVIFFGKAHGSAKLSGVGVLIIGFFWAFFLYLASELIRLLLDMENRLHKIENSVQIPKREIR